MESIYIKYSYRIFRADKNCEVLGGKAYSLMATGKLN